MRIMARDKEESREKRFPIATAAEAGCAKMQKDMKELQGATEKVTDAFKCQWDDQVKNSYRKYDQQCKEYTVELNEQVKKFKSACDAIQDIDVGELIRRVEDCCRSVENACSGS